MSYMEKTQHETKPTQIKKICSQEIESVGECVCVSICTCSYAHIFCIAQNHSYLSDIIRIVINTLVTVKGVPLKFFELLLVNLQPL